MIKTVLIGRITHDLELSVTPSGKEVTNFTVASDRAYGKDENGNKITDFVDCVAWGQTAVFLSKYYHKGKMIFATGELQSRRYTDSQGNKRVAWEVKIEDTSFCGDRASASSEISQNADANMQTISNDEELPF